MKEAEIIGGGGTDANRNTEISSRLKQKWKVEINWDFRQPVNYKLHRIFKWEKERNHLVLNTKKVI